MLDLAMDSACGRGRLAAVGLLLVALLVRQGAASSRLRLMVSFGGRTAKLKILQITGFVEGLMEPVESEDRPHEGL